MNNLTKRERINMTHSLNTIDKIIIHCSASREDRDYTIQDLARDHKARGFTTIGYHRFIRKDGTVHIGRPYTMKGAHAAPFNTNSIGICYEGGLSKNSKPKDTRTQKQKEVILDLIFDVLIEVAKAGGNTKNIKILGHRDISPDLDGDGIVEPHEWIKSCPCYEVKQEYKDIVNTFKVVK